MVWAAIGTAAGTLIGGVVGGVIQGNAQKSAAQQQASAADRATALQYQMFQQQRADVAPWTQAGGQAVSQLYQNAQTPFTYPTFDASQYAWQEPTEQDILNAPEGRAYQFRVQQGLKAMNNAGAAAGMTMSGQQQARLQGYGQDMATQEYANIRDRMMQANQLRFGRAFDVWGQGFNQALLSNQFNTNRLQAIAGLGQTSTGQLLTAGSGTATRAGDYAIGRGNALAAQQLASATPWLSAIQGTNAAANQYLTMRAWQQRMGQGGDGLNYDYGGYGGYGLYGSYGPTGLGGGGQNVIT